MSGRCCGTVEAVRDSVVDVFFAGRIPSLLKAGVNIGITFGGQRLVLKQAAPLTRGRALPLHHLPDKRAAVIDLWGIDYLLHQSRRQPAAREVLSFLDRLDIVAKICDALAHSRFVVVFKVLKDGAPHRHFDGTMCREARAKPQHAHNVVVGIFAEMALGEGGEIRHPSSQCGGGWAVAFPIRPVAGRAILFVHRSSRWDVGGREL